MTSAKQWFSAAELAEMKLAGLPASERNMREKANREGWQSRKREGRGGGMEYQPPKAILQQIYNHLINLEAQAETARFLGLQHERYEQKSADLPDQHQAKAGGETQPKRGLHFSGLARADYTRQNSRGHKPSGQHDGLMAIDSSAIYTRDAGLGRSYPSGQHDALNARGQETGLSFDTSTLVANSSGKSLVSERLDALDNTDEPQRATHLARGNIVRFVNLYPGSVGAALQALNAGLQAGTLTPNQAWSLKNAYDKQRAESQLGVSTYNKWVDKFKKTGSYAPGKRQKDYSVKPWHGLAIALRQRPQGSNLRYIASEIAKTWSLNTAPPSYDTIYRFFDEKFSTGEQLKGRFTGSKLRSFQFYQHRTADGLAPGDEVHGDGWNTHFTAPHPVTGEFVTYEVWHFHDVATRFVPTPAIGLTENSEVISKAIENVIRELGVPLHLQTDSTKVVRGNDKFTKSMHSLEERLGFTWVHPQTVGNSQANGIAENYNSSWLDMRSRELATYQNKNSMDDLTFKRVKKITTDMVKAQHAGNFALRDQKRLEATRMGKGLVFESYDHAVQWLLTVNAEFNDRPHRSLKKVRDIATGKMRQQTPKEALQEHLNNGWKPTALTETELIDAFRPHAIVKVVRETVSPYGGMRYRHEALRHWTGKTVVVAYDITDYKSVWVKDHKGALICEAEFVQATGYRTLSAQEFAAEKRTTATLKRIDKKRDTVIARADGQHVIEHNTAMNKLTPFVPAAIIPERQLTSAETRRLLYGGDDQPKNEKAA